MPINIKNEEISSLINELARETGETITVAVGTAVKERLEQLRRKKRREGAAHEAMKIARDIKSRMPPEWLTWDYDADLYDEKGLPK